MSKASQNRFRDYNLWPTQEEINAHRLGWTKKTNPVISVKTTPTRSNDMFTTASQKADAEKASKEHFARVHNMAVARIESAKWPNVSANPTRMPQVWAGSIAPMGRPMPSTSSKPTISSMKK